MVVALSVNTPEPSIVKEDAPVTLPVISIFPVPPIVLVDVKTKALVVLFNVNASWSILILEAATEVITPGIVLLPEMLLIPPVVELIPVLDTLIVSWVSVIPPCIYNAAPLEIEVVPAVVPKAFACWILSTPLLTTVFPV